MIPQLKEHPLFYNGWLIRRDKESNNLSAEMLSTGEFINPLYSSWGQLKLVIDAIKE